MVITAQTTIEGVINGRPHSHVAVHTDEITRINIHGIFRARPTSITAQALAQMERRERRILILLDGQRTIDDVMHLLHRSEVEVALVLIRLLKNGHIDYMGIRRV